MAIGTGPETSRDRRALVADAGYRRLSLFSAVAGLLSAMGTLAAAAGVTAGVMRADGRDPYLPLWRRVDLTEGLLVAGGLAFAFLVGGYVAGRMARRAGILHGLAVAVLGLAASVAAVLLAEVTAPPLAIVVSIAALVVAAVLGGLAGERWHAKLVSRALNPEIGAEAEARRDARRRAAEAEELRTASYDRARLATPSRTRRVDREAVRPGRTEPNAESPAPGATAPPAERSGARTG